MKRKKKKEEGGEDERRSKEKKTDDSRFIPKKTSKKRLIAIVGGNSSPDLQGPSGVAPMAKTSRTSGPKNTKDQDGTKIKRKRSSEEKKPAKKAKANPEEKQQQKTDTAAKRKRSSDDKVDNKKAKMSPRSTTEDQASGRKKSTVPLNISCFTFYRRLGFGAFGEVHLARDKIRNEIVAIKRIKKCSSFSPELDQNFVERDILKLSHQSRFLIQGLAAFHTRYHLYYVMELADGGDLDTFMRKNFPLEVDTVRFIAAEIICGMEFLHSKNILHRDLKPNNIMITSGGHVKVIDFGLSTSTISGKCSDPRGGTPGYVAPEKLRHEEHGEGLDWFAFGVTMYNMVTCRQPFPGGTKAEINSSVLEHTPHFPPSLSPDIVDIIEQLLQKNPHERLGVYGSVRKHPFFNTTDWEEVESGRATPPAVMVTDSAKIVTGDIMPAPSVLDITIPIGADNKLYAEFSFISPQWSETYHVIPVHPDT